MAFVFSNQFLKKGRGSAETSVAMPGLWFDLDVVGPHHKRVHYPESNEIALDFVNNLPWKPTILVHSGNGYQLLFLFRRRSRGYLAITKTGQMLGPLAKGSNGS